MSGPIKAEDVTPELAQSLLEWTSIVPRQARAKVAEMANAMIDAGLVSPPCYTVRDPNSGRLFFDCGQVRLRPGKPQIPAHEHWKGQTN